MPADHRRDDVLPAPIGVPSAHPHVALLIGTTLEEANLGLVQPGSRARTAPIVSASAGSLSGRYRRTRANRSATPPG
ncbi:hypothetical protein CBI38_09965 [Rhodococcus oxybenzonivorans]|uniref:Uncharacterized protein n=1 Tax=Rhodococcus oxybenzonivorans TaxID=1990687 RepID=A0A2S2BTF5_9NOCA|nr:hypothetical protein CBI38_09965 [Rhodococcus oxybenzonivorans]